MSTIHRMRLAGCFVGASMLSGGAPAFAQPTVSRSAISITASAGIVNAGRESSGGGFGPVLSGSVDVPVRPKWSVRVSAGRLHWHPTRDWFPGMPYAGPVSLDHVNVTLVRQYKAPRMHDPWGVFAGLGGGKYWYRIEQGRFTNPNPGGLLALFGIEYQKFERRLGYRLEMQFHVTGGPNHPQIWTDMMPAASLVAGITRRF